MDIPKNSIIYCDPPYKNTAKYDNNIDHEQFWQWCREKSLEHEVYISEYEAPEDFICIWEKSTIVDFNNKTDNLKKLIKTNKNRTEKLFIYNKNL